MSYVKEDGKIIDKTPSSEITLDEAREIIRRNRRRITMITETRARLDIKEEEHQATIDELSSIIESLEVIEEVIEK